MFENICIVVPCIFISIKFIQNYIVTYYAVVRKNVMDIVCVLLVVLCGNIWCVYWQHVIGMVCILLTVLCVTVWCVYCWLCCVGIYGVCTGSMS